MFRRTPTLFSLEELTRRLGRLARKFRKRSKARTKPHLRIETFESRQLLATDMAMVQNLNFGNPDANVQFMLSDQTFYFTKETPESGRELWSLTQQLTDLNPGNASSNPTNVTNHLGSIYFYADDGLSFNLWRLAASGPGASRVTNTGTGPNLNLLGRELVSVGNDLFFTASDGTSGFELWKFSGNSLSLVRDINTGAASSTPQRLTNVGGRLYFMANDGVRGDELWTSDGTSAGTALVADIQTGTASSSPDYLTNVSGTLYFRVQQATQSELWRVSAAGVATHVLPAAGFAEPTSPAELTNVNGKLAFTATTAAAGRELWTLDAQSQSVMVTDIVPGAASSDPLELTDVSGQLYFRVGSNSLTNRLWKSDLSSSGTISLPETGNNVQNLTNIAGRLYYSKQSNLLRVNVAATDVEPVYPLMFPGVVGDMANHQGKIMFTEAGRGGGLWMSDGTTVGTSRASNFPFDASSNIEQMVNVNGSLYMTFNEYVLGSYDTIGIVNKDSLNASIYRLGVSTRPSYNLYNINGTVYFSDGQVIKRLPPASLAITVRDFTGIGTVGVITELNGLAYFPLTNANGTWLYKSDGTAAGTVQVRSISSPTSAQIDSMFNAGGTLFFAARDAAGGRELWKSDGTAAGTNMVRDIAPGAAGSYPTTFANIGSVLYFAASNATSGRELWRSDGTSAGTFLVKEIGSGSLDSNPGGLVTMGNQVFFSADGPNGNELWRSDGTDAGTVEVRDINPSGSSAPGDLVNVSGTLYFVANRHTYKPELWKSDGTAAGTTLVRSFAPAVGPAFIDYVVNYNGTLFFTARIYGSGARLWKSDGTSAGTVAFTTTSGATSPQIGSVLVVAGDKLFFVGLTDRYGGELYVLGAADYGDADTHFTTAADIGASHFANGPMLGTKRDSNELDGVRSANADADDLNVEDDEDGLLAPVVGAAGGTMNVSLFVSGATAQTKIYMSFDFNLDKQFTALDNQVTYFFSNIVNGVNNLTVNVPATAKRGTGAMRVRVTDSTFGPLDSNGIVSGGKLLSGEVEDYLFTNDGKVTFNLPVSSSGSNVIVRRSGTNLQVINRPNSQVLLTLPLSEVSQLTLVGNDTQTDVVQVDYATGGFFVVEQGILFRQTSGDQLRITGSGTATATYTLDSSNRATVTYTQGAESNFVTYTGFPQTLFEGITTFDTLAQLTLINTTMTISADATVNFRNNVTLNNSSVRASQMTLKSGQTLIGGGSSNGGAVVGRFFGEANTQIQTMGTAPLFIGDNASRSGFATLGSITTGINTVLLRDSDQAELGPSTIIGTATVAGTLNAVNGLIIPASGEVTGNGQIASTNLSSQAVINRGRITGTDATRRLFMSGFVTGDGQITQATVTGTLSPGVTTVTANYSQMVLSGRLISELGGPTPGTEYDQIQHTGNITLGGVLDVRLVNGYTPAGGARFRLIQTTGTITNTFASTVLPAAPAGSSWELIYTTNTVELQLLALTMSVDNLSISENGGAATGTVTRNGSNLSQSMLVNLSNSDTSELMIPATVLIPAGQASATFPIVAVDDTLLDGSIVVTLTAAFTNYSPAILNVTVNDYETLSLSIAPGSMSERGGTAVGTVRRNNTDIASPITVQLANFDTSEATVPNTVTILAGEATANFSITAVDDDLLDGSQVVSITASSSGYVGASQSLTVTDFETLSLTIDVLSMSEAGGTALARVRRNNTDIGLPLTVNLSSSDTTEATVPSTVLIPANQSQVDFTITAVDDALLDGTQTVAINATATGYQAAAGSIDVTDAESLDLSFAFNEMSERGGTIIATVLRLNTDIGSEVIVSLASSDTTEATVPATVSIPAGRSSANFVITAVDDTLLDGSQTVAITYSANRYNSQPRAITVRDFETLTVTIDRTSMSEVGGTAIGTVRRSNTDIAQPLVVTLVSNDTTEATVPASVTIPANETQATFAITAVNDTLADGTQTAQISASASGYISVAGAIDVLDSVSLSLVVAPLVISENGGQATGTIARSNSNIGTDLIVTVVSNNTSAALVPATVIIPANQSSASFTISAVDDTLLDGTHTAIITISAAGYVSDNETITVTDFETLTLSFDVPTINELGGQTTGRITRNNSDLAAPLVVQLTNSDLSEVSVPVTVTIPAGQASTTFTLSAVDDTVLDGTQTATITAAAAGYIGSSASINVTDLETVSIAIDVTSVSEASGTATGRVTRSNTNNGNPLTVQLSSSDTSEATVPATVTIPAGQASVAFTITVIDDTLLDGPQSVTMVAQATDYQGSNASLIVTDFETLTVTLNVTTLSEFGGQTTGRVTRSNTDIAAALNVQLVSSDTTEATVPAVVTIPAGQSSVAFAVAAVDDNLLDGTQTLDILASASGYQGVQAALSVTDFETLTLTISPGSISELGGQATGRVTRNNTDISAPLVVQLASNDVSEATVPASVTIPAGQAFTTFTVAAVDDALLDGTQSVNISATATGYQNSQASINVTDYEALSLTLDALSISELGGQTTGRVSRNAADTSSAVTIQISSSDTSEATVPASVTIAAGQVTASFTITAVDDTLLDGTQSITIVVSAIGYESSNLKLDVTDFETVSLTVDTPTISERNGQATGRVTRSNTDLTAPLVVQLASDNTAAATVPASVTIPAGQAAATFTINAVDDDLLDGTQPVNLSASASAYQGSSATLSVTDFETLTVTVDPNSISESGGQATGTVRRNNTDISADLVVQLTSSDTTEATVPVSVTIPAGQSTATFALIAIDDTLLDASQVVSISAAASGYQSSTTTVTINDYETLTLSLQTSSMSELGGTVTAQVTRSNTDTGAPLVVLVTSSDSSEASVPTTVTIPAGQASVTFVITAVDDTLLDGSQSVAISISAVGYQSANQSVTITDLESLAVTIDIPSISEFGGQATGRVTRSNSDTAAPLVIDLTSSDTSEALIPATVTIPAGQTSATFTISAVDDSILDGSQTVQLSATATNYDGGMASLTVTDHETLTLALVESSLSERNGQGTGSVSRSNSDTSAPLTVQLAGDDASELSVPVTVTIPAGQTSTTFTLAAVDDNLLDGTQTVRITASASDYESSSRNLDVTDYETLTVTIDPSSISEFGGQAAGRVTRNNSDTTAALVVNLTSSDTSEANVPASVTIPAGQASITFAIASVDDSLLDGTQTVSVTASAAGYQASTANVDVTDHETLSVTIDPSSISELGGQASGRVTRNNSDTTAALVVSLVSSDTSEASVPASVTIPAGQASVTFTVTAVDDSLLDGTQSVSVTASADGYQTSAVLVDVTDHETLTVTIDPSSISELGGQASGRVTRNNSDTTAALVVSLVSSDTSEASVPASVTIPAGQSSITFTVAAADDSLLDGTQTVSVTASAVGYQASTANVDVTDHETLSVTIDPSSISELGGQASGRVTRNNSDTTAALVVSLTSSDTSEANVPASVTIPAGQSSITFTVTAVDDSLLDGTQTVSVTASAVGYQASSSSVDVTDYETLTLTIDPSSISEKGGQSNGRVTRSNSDTSTPLTVQIVSNNPAEATAPATLTIPSGQASATFVITAVDETLVDGPKSFDIIVTASGYQGQARAAITVTDNDRLFPWQNERNALDVNDSGQVSPLDALLVINAINSRQVLTPQLPEPFDPVAYVDVNGDGFLSAIDALLVINFINSRPAGEGESQPSQDAIAPIESFYVYQFFVWSDRKLDDKNE